MKSLVEVIRSQVEVWIRETRSPFGKNRWLEGTEGKAYIRYSAGLSRLDLASIELDPENRRMGTSKQIIQVLCSAPVRTVLIENIQVPGWAKKLGCLEFPGRRTILTDLMDGQLFKVEYVKEDHDEQGD